jgi:hypothetical protein
VKAASRALIVLIAGSAGLACADSITTTDNLTTHGHLSRLDQNEAVIQSRFATESKEETKELRIPRNVVLKIEFNGTTFNPGGPPSIGLRPPEAAKSPASQSVGSDVIILRGGERRQCESASIDDGKVRCGKKDETERNSVIRIELGRR